MAGNRQGFNFQGNQGSFTVQGGFGSEPVLTVDGIIPNSQGDVDRIARRSRALRHFKAALSARADLPVDLLFIGDSLPAGQLQTKLLTKTYPAVFRDLLRAKYPTPGVAGGPGVLAPTPLFYNNALGVAADNPVACSFSAYQIAVGGAGRNGAQAMLLGAGQYMEWTFTGTGFDLNVFYGAIVGGSAIITVDGASVSWDGATTVTATHGNLIASAVPLTTASGYTALTASMAIFGQRSLSVGVHKVRVTWVSGYFAVGDLFAYNGDEGAGIRLCQTTFGGQGINSYYAPSGTPADSQNAWWAYNMGAGAYVPYQPDLVVIDNIDNDMGGTVASIISPAAHLAYTRGLIASIKACIGPRLGYLPSFILQRNHAWNPGAVGTPTQNGGIVMGQVNDYWANWDTIADTDPDGVVTVFDIAHQLTSSGQIDFANTYDGLLSNNDKIHFSDYGSDWVANRLLDFVSAA